MKLRTAVALTFFGIATLACGGGGGGTSGVDYNSFAVDITEPWASMGLPVDSGAVMMSDDSIISVNYQNTTVDDQMSSWVSALEGAGWAKEGDMTEMSGIKTQTFKKDGKSLSLTGNDTMGTTSISATIY